MGNQELRQAGLKVTAPRTRIFDLFTQQKGGHFTAEDVYRLLSEEKEADPIALATIYRVLAQFETAGLIIRHRFEEDKAVYELSDGEHHDHMIDVDTGEVIEFCNPEIEALQKSVAREKGYELVDHNLVLYVKKTNP